MQTQFRNKHFITLQEWTKEEIDKLLDVSFELKRHFAMGVPTPYLSYKTIFLMFFEQSTRRNSMEAGIAQLEGMPITGHATMQIAHGDRPRTRPYTFLLRPRIACRNCFWDIGNKSPEMAEWPQFLS